MHKSVRNPSKIALNWLPKALGNGLVATVAPRCSQDGKNVKIGGSTGCPKRLHFEHVGAKFAKKVFRTRFFKGSFARSFFNWFLGPVLRGPGQQKLGSRPDENQIFTFSRSPFFLQFWAPFWSHFGAQVRNYTRFGEPKGSKMVSKRVFEKSIKKSVKKGHARRYN